MNNKTVALDQFCSNENLQYLAYMTNWNKDSNDLQEVVLAFMKNNKSYVSNSEDMWKSVRYLNRRFIETVNPRPNTETTYNTPAEWYLWKQEIYS